ncbi:MAG: bifunctional precorrin-2 dehydrogenase/sirohydrochlorin ferrochelatase [Desulfobacteraceae bacterium]|nr:bifunctional precorrin-2 dehydrogenase/sirohydrochlorin ferrochelatase [Desulfobacteraceae bacterium]
MKYYPVFLDVKDRDCLVVGGGKVGTRKALGLSRAGARVRVISKTFSPGLEAVEKTGIFLDCKPYETLDLENIFLVFAATDNRELNLRIQEDAKKQKLLCNIADVPVESDFILPSVITRGDLVCAVSTSGTSPALAKKIRKDLEHMFGPEYGQFLLLMGNIRKKLLEEGHDPDSHKKIFTALVEKNLPGMIAAGDETGINSILAQLLGRGYVYQSLVSQEQ